ncbi:MAG: hypothetical protein WA421_08400 [Nitrososphaeraceae archaeon]
MRINIDNNNNNNNQVSNIKEERDLELENIIGNLMVAQFQVDKLRHRLSERITGYGSVRNKKASAHIFKDNDKWYKVTIKVDEIALDSFRNNI